MSLINAPAPAANPTPACTNCGRPRVHDDSAPWFCQRSRLGTLLGVFCGACVHQFRLGDVQRLDDGCAHHVVMGGTIVERCPNPAPSTGMYAAHLGGRLCRQHTKEAMRITGRRGFMSRGELALRHLALKIQEAGVGLAESRRCLAELLADAAHDTTDDDMEDRVMLVYVDNVDEDEARFGSALEDKIRDTTGWRKASARDRCVVVEVVEEGMADANSAGKPSWAESLVHDPDPTTLDGRTDRYLLRVHLPTALFAEETKATGQVVFAVLSGRMDDWRRFVDTLAGRIFHLLFAEAGQVGDQVQDFGRLDEDQHVLER